MVSAELDLVKLGSFLVATYCVGYLVQVLGFSPILGHIVVGAVLGPPLANFAPAPNGLILAGMLGIQLSVVEAGLMTNLSTLRQLAPRSLLIAVLGIVFPIGGAVSIVYGKDSIERTLVPRRTFRSAFAAGAAIAPTSLGVTAQLLLQYKQLDTTLGRLISIAAVFDDVISLILLAEVNAVAGDNIAAWQLVRPILFSCVFIVCAVALAFAFPHAFNAQTMERVGIAEDIRWRVGLLLIFAVVTGGTYVATLAETSFLLAGYLTGVAFADTDSSIFSNPWKSNVSVQIGWLVILFFAATIGFVIPLKDLFQSSALGLGALMATAGTVGKLLCGLGALPNKVDGVAIGVAMLGRGEFGFLIAASARSLRLLDQRLYAATIWGVLVPTLITPLLFGFVFKWRQKHLESQNGGGPTTVVHHTTVNVNNQITINIQR